MRKTLSFIAITAFAFIGNANAQTTTWDFTTTSPTWAGSGVAAVSGVAGEFVDSKGLGLHGIATNNNFAAWNSSSSATWAAPADAFAGTVRVQTNGAGYGSTGSQATPTQRYFFIQVDKACTVKVWFKSGSGGAQRSVIASDGAAIYGKATTNTGSTDGMPTDGQFLNAAITKGGTFYLYGDSAINIYQIQVEGATVALNPTNTLAVADASQKSEAKIYSSGNRVYVSNLSGKNNEVNVYASTGALVKSVKASSDTSFEVNGKGVYIITLKSEGALQSEKVLIK